MFGSCPTRAMRALRMCLASSWNTAAGAPAGASASDNVTDGFDGRACANTSAVCFVRTSGLEMIWSKSTPRCASALASFFSARDPVAGQRPFRIVRIVVTAFGGNAVSNQIELERRHISAACPARLRVLAAATIFSGRDRLGECELATSDADAGGHARAGAGTATTYLPCKQAALLLDPARDGGERFVWRRRGRCGAACTAATCVCRICRSCSRPRIVLRSASRVRTCAAAARDPAVGRELEPVAKLLGGNPHLVKVLGHVELAGRLDRRRRGAAIGSSGGTQAPCARRRSVSAASAVDDTERAGGPALHVSTAASSLSIVSRRLSRSPTTCSRTSCERAASRDPSDLRQLVDQVERDVQFPDRAERLGQTADLPARFLRLSSLRARSRAPARPRAAVARRPGPGGRRDRRPRPRPADTGRSARARRL